MQAKQPGWCCCGVTTKAVAAPARLVPAAEAATARVEASLATEKKFPLRISTGLLARAGEARCYFFC